jgi:hypothetical protein
VIMIAGGILSMAVMPARFNATLTRSDEMIPLSPGAGAAKSGVVGRLSPSTRSARERLAPVTVTVGFILKAGSAAAGRVKLDAKSKVAKTCFIA